MARYCKALQITEKRVNKKGKLKGRNKKETKKLKQMCMHHRIARSGKIKPTYFIQDGECICRRCGQRFPARLFAKDEYEERIDDMLELTDQMKYLALAGNAGNETADYAVNLHVQVAQSKKVYKRLKKICSKRSSVKDKRRKKTYYGSNQYGGWGSNGY